MIVENETGNGSMCGKSRLLCAILMVDAFLAGICISAAGGAGPVNDFRSSCLQERSVGAGAFVGILERQDEKNSVSGEKYVALTFDDGPHRIYTERLLDGLRERDVKASFFLLGDNIPGNERLVRRMAKEGHLVGVHCLHHVDMTKIESDEACREILETGRRIQELTGTMPEYIRPPYGAWSEELEECVGMLPVFWDIDTLDWKSQDVQAVVAEIRRRVGRHQIVLLHDVFSSSVEAALEAIDALSQEGYVFVTVDELLID